MKKFYSTSMTKEDIESVMNEFIYNYKKHINETPINLLDFVSKNIIEVSGRNRSRWELKFDKQGIIELEKKYTSDEIMTIVALSIVDIAFAFVLGIGISSFVNLCKAVLILCGFIFPQILFLHWLYVLPPFKLINQFIVKYLCGNNL